MFKFRKKENNYPKMASNTQIRNKSNKYRPIVPANVDFAVRSVKPVVSTTLPATAVVNNIYNLGIKDAVSITLPSAQIGDFIQVDFVSGSIATSLTISSSAGLTDVDLTPQSDTIYSLYFDWGAISYSGTSVSYGWRCNYYEYPIEVV